MITVYYVIYSFDWKENDLGIFRTDASTYNKNPDMKYSAMKSLKTWTEPDVWDDVLSNCFQNIVPGIYNISLETKCHNITFLIIIS